LASFGFERQARLRGEGAVCSNPPLRSKLLVPMMHATDLRNPHNPNPPPAVARRGCRKHPCPATSEYARLVTFTLAAQTPRELVWLLVVMGTTMPRRGFLIITGQAPEFRNPI